MNLTSPGAGPAVVDSPCEGRAADCSSTPALTPAEALGDLVLRTDYFTMALVFDEHGQIVSAPALDALLAERPQAVEPVLELSFGDPWLPLAEYARRRHGLKSARIVWQAENGRASASTVQSLESAHAMHERGYVVIPCPADDSVQAAYDMGVIDRFLVHRRRGFCDARSLAEPCLQLRQMGYERLTVRIAGPLPEGYSTFFCWAAPAAIDELEIELVDSNDEASIRLEAARLSGDKLAIPRLAFRPAAGTVL